MRITTFYGFRPANSVRSLWIVCRFFLKIFARNYIFKGVQFPAIVGLLIARLKALKFVLASPRLTLLQPKKTLPRRQNVLQKEMLLFSLYAGNCNSQRIIPEGSTKRRKMSTGNKKGRTNRHCCWWVKPCIDLVDDPWLVVFHTSSITQESDHQQSETVDTRQKNCVGFSISLTLPIFTTFTQITNRLKKDPGCPTIFLCKKKISTNKSSISSSHPSTAADRCGAVPVASSTFISTMGDNEGISS